MNLKQFLEKGEEVEARWLVGGRRWQDYHKRVWPFIVVRRALGIETEDELRQTGRTRGNFNFKGELVRNGPVKCERCESNNVFQGRYDNESELVMYAECGGVDDESNYVVDTYQFIVCLNCLNYKEDRR